MVYRWSWKKYTKVGLGALITADYNNFDNFRSDVFIYGVAFGDLHNLLANDKNGVWANRLAMSFYNREYKYAGPYVTEYL